MRFSLRFASPFALLFTLNFLSWMALNSTSLLPPYLAVLGAGQTFIGLFNILGNLVTVVFVVVFGKSLARWRRVRVLRWGYVALIVSSVLSWVFSGSLAALTLLRLIGSLAQVFSSTLMLSVLLDLTPPGKRTGGIALFSVAGMLTNPLTALSGEAVLRMVGGKGLFILGGVFAVAAGLLSLALEEPPHIPQNEPHSFREVVCRPDMRSLLVLAFFFGIFYAALVTFLPRYTQLTLGEANLSAFLTPFSLVSIGIRVVLKKQFDEKPPRRFLVWSFLAVLASLLCLLAPPTWVWLILAGAFYGVGHSILYPLMNSLFVVKGGENQKAVYSNAYLVANLLGAVLLTPILGALGDAFGFQGIVVALALTALFCLFLVRSRFPRLAER